MPRVPQGGKRNSLPQQGYPYRNPLSPDAVNGGCPEDHGEKHIDARCRKQQRLPVNICIKHAARIRNALACQQSQCQNSTGQRTRHSKSQQCQPPEALFAAKGCQRQKHPHRGLDRQGGQEAPSRQKYRRCIQPAQHTAQRIPATAQGDPCQPGRRKHQQIVQQGIKKEHTVQIHHRHGFSPFQEDYTAG